MELENLVNEDIHDILESYFDRMKLSEEEHRGERVRCGPALMAYAKELSRDIEKERFHYLREVAE